MRLTAISLGALGAVGAAAAVLYAKAVEAHAWSLFDAIRDLDAAAVRNRLELPEHERDRARAACFEWQVTYGPDTESARMARR